MKRNVIIAVATAAAVVGGGTLTGIALGSSEDGTEEISAPASVPGAQPGGAPQGGDGTGDGHPAATDGSAPERAAATALAEVPGVVTGVEREDDDGENGWDVGVWGEDGRFHWVAVSEDGERVLGSGVAADDDADDRDDDWDDDWDDDRDDDRDALAALLTGDGVSAAAAIALAQDYTSASLRELELDDDATHWEAELRGEDGAEYELHVDVATGEITSGDRDGDRDDRDDDRDDDRHDG